jgi:hypothetical protein
VSTLIPAFLVIASLSGLVPRALPTSAAVSPPWDPFFANQTTIADFGAATRPFGVAAGDFDGDGKADLVVGRTTGNVAFVKGNGDGTFAAPSVFTWKQAFNNAWAFAPADVNGDGKLDVIWGANASSTGCSVSPVPATGCPSTITVNDGDVRSWLGNGNGTFAETAYFVSGVRHNAGVLLGRVALTDAGSVAAGDIDGDGDLDVVAGAVDGANSVVKVLRNTAGVFIAETLISQPAACATPCSPIYFPAISTQNSPWGLSFGDADGDGDKDLWVGDRALYLYLYLNDGTGTFALKGGNTALADRPNAYLRHDSYRAAVGFTPSLGSGDINGDGKSDVVLGLHSGTQTPASNTANDGAILLNVSKAGAHSSLGSVADVGTMTRGVSVVDVNGDGALDIVAAEYDGKMKLLRQLAPVDSDNDGVSDYVDNAPAAPNAARIDLNTDGTINYRDQLDNDFDTVLGNPEDPSTWQRLGDPVDTDDDNDGLADTEDNCPFVGNLDQANSDTDAFGDACDPLDNRDPDQDGVPTGPMPGDPLYEEALAAKIKWSTGDTHFVVRIDALGRLFQNEFTQLMSDAAVLSPEEWAAKCWENYQSDDIINGSAYEPCGTGEGTAGQTITLPGGKGVPVTTVVIPRLLWTDGPVITWINDRNDNPLFEVGQHGTYHFSNTSLGDWKDLADRNFFSCETCGMSEAESFELLKAGFDTLVGNYANKWVAESGASASSPKIDWTTSANPLISYAPPFNASDTASREATAQLGFKSFSASVHEEDTLSLGQFFSPEGSHHEQFDQFGMYHASADVELEPPVTAGGTYDPSAYAQYLQQETQAGELNTWLIEEVEWSGRPCNDADRLADLCNGGSNRENNTVYGPRWQGWMQLLDYVKSYPGGVVMTMGEVALAEGFDNAPTVANPDQSDSDQDGIGDVIEGAALAAPDANLSRNQAGTLSATLTNGEGAPLSGQLVSFSFDADGDGVDETYTVTSGANGTAEASVTATRPTGPGTFTVSWDGGRGVTASGTGNLAVKDASTVTLSAINPSSGQVTDQVTVGAKLVDSDGAPITGRTLQFSIGNATATATTGPSGEASAALTLQSPAGTTSLQVSFAGDSAYGSANASTAFTVSKENTQLTLADAVATKNSPAVARATLTEADGATLAGKTIKFYVESKEKGQTTFVLVGTAVTNAQGVAALEIPSKYVSQAKKAVRAEFSEDASFLGTTASAFTYR